MKVLKFNATLYALLILCLTCTRLDADVVLGFSADRGLTFSDSADIRTDSNTTIDIYVLENGSNDELSTLGLIGFGLDVAATPGTYCELRNFRVNPQFDLENVNTGTSTGFQWEYFQVSNEGVKGTSVLLGSFDVFASGSGTTEIVFSDLVPGNGFTESSWFLPNAGSLDQEIFGPDAVDTYSFTVNSIAVPEPGSSTLFAIGSAIVLLRRNRSQAK
jgi:hypothetical protein